MADQIPVRYIVGLMSGTSTDGVDAALVEIKGSGLEQKVRLVEAITVAFDDEMRKRIFKVYPPHTFTGEEISKLNFDLGEIYAQAVLEVVQKAGMMPSHIYAVGSRGLTVFHGPPEPGQPRGHRFEIGEAAIIAERTGITVVSDYGYRDQAAGGLGGVVGSYVDYLLFHHDSKTRAVHNIGGIANVSSLVAGHSIYDLISFDTGPGNVFIDFAAEKVTGGAAKFDRDGEIAAQGTVCQALVDELLQHPYISKSPPKSTGREVFSLTMFQRILARVQALQLSDADFLAAMTAYTAQSMVRNYELFLYPRGCLDEVILRGGGAYNKTLVRMLRELLAPIPVYLHEDFGYSSAFREAMDWAIVAGESMLGRPDNLPNVTRAKRRIVFGKFTPGQFEWGWPGVFIKQA